MGGRDVTIGAEGRAGAPAFSWLSLCGLAVAAQVVVLHLLGRDWVCPCGSVVFWQGRLDPAQNSQQITDPYTLLHIAFGCGLFLWLSAIRPHWPLARRALYAVASSVVWEIVENLPIVIRLFASEGSSLRYSGDSIVNSLADTVAATLGFVVAARLPKAGAVALVAALEASTFALIGDSILVGAVRLLAGAPPL